ncbi:MAG: glycosyltransferase family 4 protein [Candidatus Freyarchaeota archaeon]
MNVLVLSKTLWPEGSGGELATYLYAKLLTQEGLDVKIVTRSTSSYFKAWNGLSIHSIPVLGSGKYTIVPTSKRLKELLRWSDVVYYVDLFHLIPLIKRVFEKPAVVHLHSYFPACPIGSLYNLKENSVCEAGRQDCARCIWCYERNHSRSSKRALASAMLNSTFRRVFLDFLKFADALIFVSKAQKSLFLKHTNICIPSHVIYNPLPELPYTPPQGGNLGYFGGLSPLKGFHILLKAWSKVHYKHQAKVYATKMGELANLESLKKIGILSHGRLDENSYEDVYRKIKAVIFPSIWQEPLPYVVSEALLRGRLLVASHVGGVPEIAEELKGVFMVEPNDANSLADALNRVLSMDRGAVIELGLKNREGILRKFDNRRIVNELIGVFEKIME